jgi:hypothetical protein
VYAVLVDFDPQHAVMIADGGMQRREGEAEIGVVAHEVRQRGAIDGERRRAATIATAAKGSLFGS